MKQAAYMLALTENEARKLVGRLYPIGGESEFDLPREVRDVRKRLVDSINYHPDPKPAA